MTGQVTGKLTIDLYVMNREDVELAAEKLSAVFPDAEVSYDKDMIFIDEEDVAEYCYYPAVYYTSNGDGQPEEYEDELPYADVDDALDMIKTALKDIEYDIESSDYERKIDEDYGLF